ncbi:peptidase dimerization domain-containing protein [Methylobacterium sp. E-041]|nr:peptidase dimerization domain-containing protein [Methylobacterium sp. E-041]MCJ2104677.1 peptidase dimerization domain-containing protein [Methylobacterium sp. E-041]
MLNSEPGRPSGDVVTGRKGGVFMASTVHGKAVHSGADPAGGTSAIGELAHKTIALHAITDLERGTTVNVGLVSGGQSVNTVAPLATCEIDLRYVRPEDREAAMARIAAIVTEATLPGISAALTIRGGPAAAAGCGLARPVRGLCRSERATVRRSRARSRAAARIPDSPPASAARLSVRSAPSAAGPILRRAKADLARIYGEFPRLAARRAQAAGTLSGGEQQMLAIGRALMARPKLVLFDEPSLGLAPNIVERMFSVIRAICDAGTTVLLVEQNAFAALELCDYAYLLETGRIVLAGKGADLIADPHVRDAYLGG